MASHEKPYHVVLAKLNGMVLDHTTCDTKSAAQDVIEQSKARDPYGWYASYEIRPMTRSELAYLIGGQ